MPITANAKKALRQQNARSERNRVVKSQVRTAVKKARKLPELSTLSALFSEVDKAVKRHILHKNKAARIKSQAAKLTVESKESAEETSKKPVSRSKTVKKTVRSKKTK